MSIKKFLSVANEINQLLPFGLVFEECLKHGIRSIALKHYIFLETPATYDENTKVIELDPLLDRDRVARTINGRWGVDIKPDEIFIWLFFHELGHHLGYKDQTGAERYARERFLDWRKTDEYHRINFRQKSIRVNF